MDGHPGVTAETFRAHDRPAPRRRDPAAARAHRAARVALLAERRGDGRGARRARGEHPARRRADARGDAAARRPPPLRAGPGEAQLRLRAPARHRRQPDSPLAYRDAEQLEPRHRAGPRRGRRRAGRRRRGQGPPAPGRAPSGCTSRGSTSASPPTRSTTRSTATSRSSTARTSRAAPHPRGPRGAPRARPLGPRCVPDRGAARDGRRAPAATAPPPPTRWSSRWSARSPTCSARSGSAAAPASPATTSRALRITPLFESLSALEQATDTMAALSPTRSTASTWAARRPPGDHARLLGLGQGRQVPHEPWAIYTRAGAARRAGAGARRGGDVLPRPRRLALARRRARPPGHPRPAARHARGRRADHRAGRGDLGQVRRPGARRPLARAAGAALLLGPRHATPPLPEAFRAEMERAAGRSCAAYRGLVDSEDFVRFFRQVSPVDELSELTIGSRPASRKAGGAAGGPARDPVGLRVDAEPDPAAVVVRRGTRAGARATSSSSARCGARGRSSAWPARRSRWRSSRSISAVGRRYLALVDEKLAERLWPVSRPSTSAWSSGCWRSGTGRAARPERRHCARGSRRNRWVDPLSHLQVELLTRVRAGDDAVGEALMATVTGDRSGHAEHRLIRCGAVTRTRVVEGRTPDTPGSADRGSCHVVGGFPYEPHRHLHRPRPGPAHHRASAAGAGSAKEPTMTVKVTPLPADRRSRPRVHDSGRARAAAGPAASAPSPRPGDAPSPRRDGHGEGRRVAAGDAATRRDSQSPRARERQIRAPHGERAELGALDARRTASARGRPTPATPTPCTSKYPPSVPVGGGSSSSIRFQPTRAGRIASRLLQRPHLERSPGTASPRAVPPASVRVTVMLTSSAATASAPASPASRNRRANSKRRRTAGAQQRAARTATNDPDARVVRRLGARRRRRALPRRRGTRGSR